MGDIGRRGNDGTRALSGLVGEDAALDAHRNGGADDAAADRVDAEGVRDDGGEHRRDVLDMECDDDEGKEDVSRRHERRDDGGDIGNSPDAAEDNDPEDRRQGDAGDERIHGESVVHSRGKAIGLHGRQEEPTGNDRDDGESDTQPALFQTLLDEAERTASVAGVMRELVNLGERGLYESRGSAEKGHHPHPEHRPRPAEGDGRRHPHDIPRAHATGQGDAECLE